MARGLRDPGLARLDGRVALHRQLGPYFVGLGIVVWSMVFVVVRGLVVHPLPAEWAGYDEMLQDAYVVLTFITLLLWAFFERRRPAWHKRLMAITTFVALLAPIERIEWLPVLGIGYIFASVVWLNLCLIVPLVAYDITSAKRLHPATARELLLMLGAQATMVLAWGTALGAISPSSLLTPFAPPFETPAQEQFRRASAIGQDVRIAGAQFG